MIGPAVPIFLDPSTKFRHGQHHDIFHAIAQVPVKRGQGLRELREPCRELPSLIPLSHMGIPSTAPRERDFYTDIGLNELRDLA